MLLAMLAKPHFFVSRHLFPARRTRRRHPNPSRQSISRKCAHELLDGNSLTILPQKDIKNKPFDSVPSHTGFGWLARNLQVLAWFLSEFSFDWQRQDFRYPIMKSNQLKHFVSTLLAMGLVTGATLAHAGESIATIISTNAICKEPGRYIGWPTIAKTRSGELLVTFSGDRDAHVCPWGVTQLIRSQDNGKTWSEPVTINNTPLDDRDSGIIETKSGALVVSWFTSLAFDNPAQVNWQKLSPEVLNTWKRHVAKVGPETREEFLGNWTRRSTDGGKTWEKPVKQIVSAPHGPIQLRDGRLLYVGLGTYEKSPRLGVEESRDDGRSWQYLAEIPVPESDRQEPNWRVHMQDEPHVVETKNGTLVALIRAEPKDRSQCYLRQTESTDGGKTWTVTHKTPIWGFPPHLIRLKNDWLLAVYGVRRPEFSERACLSKDGGKTWDIANEVILRTALNGDLGYPSSVQLDDGSIYTIYYQADQPGEKTSLLSTHWKLKE